MATHDHEMVRKYGHRIVHVEQGEIVKDEHAFGAQANEARRALVGEELLGPHGAPQMPAGAPPVDHDVELL